MKSRVSASGREVLLSLTLLTLPGLLLLSVLLLSARRIPVSSLKLISEEGAILYYNTATIRNVDVLFSGEQPGWQERLVVADYLLYPVLLRLAPDIPLIRSAVNRLGAMFLDGLLMPVQIRDLALLVREGATPVPASGRAPADTLKRSGIHGEIYSTISDAMQKNIAAILRSELAVLREAGAYQASVVVLERQKDHLQLRAMVDTGSAHGLNGALLVHQAGSVLKPLIYMMAFDRFSLRPGDAVDDTPLRIYEKDAVYEPRNHDNQFTGRITIREALAASRNIPAIRMLQLVGVSEYARFLKDAGLDHIDQPQKYGLSLALGTGGASVLQVALLFSIAPAGGELLPLYMGYDGQPIFLTATGRPVRERPSIRRFFSQETSLLITHVLSDREARRISFGHRNFLDFPFEVAAKTGTSQSFRDSWTAGYTDRYIVAVWVGNYRGASMNAVSGLRGAARVFHQVVRMLVGGKRPSFRYPPGWKTTSICRHLEEDRNCSRIEELSLPEKRQLDESVRRILLDRPGALLLSPLPDQVFYLDPHRHEGQSIPFELSAPAKLTLIRNGAVIPEFDGRNAGPGRLLIRLDRGRYEIVLMDQSGRSVRRHFEVR